MVHLAVRLGWVDLDFMFRNLAQLQSHFFQNLNSPRFRRTVEHKTKAT